MTLLSTSSHLIKVGQDYSAGNGISIDDHVISVTGDSGTTYSAGDNINIYEQDEQLYISSKDWTNDIANASANAYNAATAQIPEPQDLSYISSKVDDKLDSTAFTNWQTGQYTTDLQTIEGQITNKLDTSSFSEVSASFLTAINIPESATWNEVSTTVQSNSAQWAEGGSGDEEVNSFVYNNSATINEVNTSYQTNSGDFLTAAPANMATTGDIAELAQSVSETYQVKGDYLVRSDSANFYPANNPSGFITGVDLSNYYTKDETSGKEELSNAFANIPVGDPEVNAYVTDNSASINGTKSLVQSNSSTWNDITAYQSNSANYLTSVNIPESATWNEVSTTVQSNSANWGNETISSYTTAYSHDIPPYGGYVINSLNGKFISAFVSKSAEEAEVATNANTATYALTVNETKLENDGFVKNLSSEYGTISVVRNTIESTNSAISRTGNEGFVSSYNHAESIGPAYTATYSWDKSLPNTEITLDMGWNGGYTLSYSANTELTGEVVLPYGESTQTINIPNATEFKVWADDWVSIKKAVASAADSFETVFGELAWASALPTYEYDNTNKISAINGSAIAAGDEFPVSADEAITAYQTNSATYLTAHQAISADEWNNCYDNVNTNSGAWGGSALPISAGPGIKVNLVDNTLVFSNDETVLWEGSAGTGTNLVLSENYNNFDRLRFEYRPWSESETPSYQISEVGTNYNNFTLGSFWNNNTTYATFIYTYQGNGTNQLNFIRGAFNNGNSWGTAGNLSMFKVIGINRK